MFKLRFPKGKLRNPMSEPSVLFRVCRGMTHTDPIHLAHRRIIQILQSRYQLS